MRGKSRAIATTCFVLLACEPKPSPAPAPSAPKVAPSTSAPSSDAGAAADVASDAGEALPQKCLASPVTEQMFWEEHFTTEFRGTSRCFHSLLPWLGKRTTRKLVTAVDKGQVTAIEAKSLELASRNPRMGTATEPMLEPENIEKAEVFREGGKLSLVRDGAYAQPLIPVENVPITGRRRGEESRALSRRMQFFLTATSEADLAEYDPPPTYLVKAKFLDERTHALGTAVAFHVTAKLPGMTMGMCKTHVGTTMLEGDVLVLKDTTIVLEAHLTGRHSAQEQVNCSQPPSVLRECANGPVALHLTTSCK